MTSPSPSKPQNIEFEDTILPPSRPKWDPNPQLSAFFEAASLEADAQQKEAADTARLTPSELILKGQLIGPVSLRPTNKNRLAANLLASIPKGWGELHTKASKCKIAIYEASSYPHKPPLISSATITNISEEEIEIATAKTCPSEPCYLLQIESDFTKSVLERLKQTRDFPAWPPKLLPEPKLNPINGETPYLLNQDPSFQKCFRACTNPNPLVAIKGPPGTGKTTLLAHVATYLAHLGLNIIVTAKSHQATDTALIEISKLWKARPELKPPIPLVKKASQDGDSNPELAKFQIPEVSETQSHPKILGRSLASLLKSTLTPTPICDYLIVDEGSQIHAYEIAAIHPLAKTILVFGDKDQLEPIAKAKQPNTLNSAESIISFLENRFPERTQVLLKNHRCNTEITAHTQRHFYPNQKLAAGANASASTLHGEETYITVDHQTFLLPQKGICFLPINHKHYVKVCPKEADIIQTLIPKILLWDYQDATGTRKLTPEDIAILSPHNQQAELIKQRIQKYCSTTIDCCGTVHKLQGAGKPVVLFSMTISNQNSLKNTDDFFTKPSLWNVATSRARALCIILGSKTALQSAIAKTAAGEKTRLRLLQMLTEIELSPNPI